MQQPFRVTPAGPVHAYQTWQIHTPKTPDYYQPASCEDVDCEHWLNGWQTRIPATAEGLLYTARHCGRPYAERAEDGEVVFVFAPGTPCFKAATHRIKVGRPELFIVRGGDWRGNPTGEHRIHSRPDDWVDEFRTHTEKLHAQQERG